MKRFVLALVLVAALAVAGVALSGPGSPSGPRVYGGGHFTQCIGDSCLTRDFSVDAHQQGSRAEGTLNYGQNGGALGVTGSVRCIAIAGTDAVVGGIITAFASGATPGQQFVLFLRDLGDPGPGTTRDESSLLYIGDESIPVLTTKGGRTVCPPPGSPINTNGFSPIEEGDVAVAG